MSSSRSVYVRRCLLTLQYHAYLNCDSDTFRPCCPLRGPYGPLMSNIFLLIDMSISSLSCNAQIPIQNAMKGGGLHKQVLRFLACLFHGDQRRIVTQWSRYTSSFGLQAVLQQSCPFSLTHRCTVAERRHKAYYVSTFR